MHVCIPLTVISLRYDTGSSSMPIVLHIQQGLLLANWPPVPTSCRRQFSKPGNQDNPFPFLYSTATLTSLTAQRLRAAPPSWDTGVDDE
jgi:hypothetical protein